MMRGGGCKTYSEQFGSIRKAYSPGPYFLKGQVRRSSRLVNMAAPAPILCSIRVSSHRLTLGSLFSLLVVITRFALQPARIVVRVSRAPACVREGVIHTRAKTTGFALRNSYYVRACVSHHSCHFFSLFPSHLVHVYFCVPLASYAIGLLSQM